MPITFREKWLKCFSGPTKLLLGFELLRIQPERCRGYFTDRLPEDI
jgi:hypothetical protein